MKESSKTIEKPPPSKETLPTLAVKKTTHAYFGQYRQPSSAV